MRAAVAIALVAMLSADAPAASAQTTSAGINYINVLLLRPEGFPDDYFTPLVNYIKERVTDERLLPSGWEMKFAAAILRSPSKRSEVDLIEICNRSVANALMHRIRCRDI